MKQKISLPEVVNGERAVLVKRGFIAKEGDQYILTDKAKVI
jgi:cytochrome oxidase assembly protein ShyY1